MARALLAVVLGLALFAGFSNADSNRPIDYPDSAEEYTTFRSLAEGLPDDNAVKNLMTDRDANGVIFVPSNTAFTSFRNALHLEVGDLTADFLTEVFLDHVTQDFPVMGTNEDKNFTTLGGQTLTFTFSESTITAIKPVEAAPASFAHEIAVATTPEPWTTSGPGNATIHFVDAVIFTKAVYEKYISKSTPNLYAAIQKYNNDTDGELSTLLAVLDSPPWEDVKSTLQSTPNGTLFAPTNAAFNNLLSALGVSDLGLPALASTDGLTELVKSVLLYHYVPGSIYDSTGEAAPTGLVLPGQDAGVTLELVMDGDNLEVSHGHPDRTFTAIVTGANAAFTTSTGFNADLQGSEARGVMHIIDTVMLPVPAAPAAQATLANFNDSMTDGSTFNIFVEALGQTGSAADLAINGPTLRGALFMPTDAAFTKFNSTVDLTVEELMKLPNLLRQIIFEHTIFDELFDVNSTKTYKTRSDGAINRDGTYEIRVVVDDSGMVQYVEREGSVPDGQPSQANYLGRTFKNYNGHVAGMVNENANGGGRIYFVDEVLVSSDTLELASDLKAGPSGTGWSKRLPGGPNAFSTLTDLIPESIQGILDGDTKFVMFMPSDEAFQALATDLDFTGSLSDALRENADFVEEMLKSYTVVFDGEGQNPKPDDTFSKDDWYQTQNSDVELQLTDSVLELRTRSNAAKRKLLASHTGGVDGDSVDFLNEARVFALSSAPLTADQRQALEQALEGFSPNGNGGVPPPGSAASIATPSLMLLLASLSGIAALLSVL